MCGWIGPLDRITERSYVVLPRSSNWAGVMTGGALFLPFQEVLVARDDRVDIVSSRECDEVVVVRVTCLGLDLVGVVDQIDDRLDRVKQQRRVLETDPLAETRTSREDLANLAEEFRAHHDLELRATTQPRLDDSMRCTTLDGGGHEHVRIDDDEHG